MPYINVKLTPDGLTREKKAVIVSRMTEILVSELGKKPEHIHIVLDVVEEENWGFAGQLTDDFRRSD